VGGGVASLFIGIAKFVTASDPFILPQWRQKEREEAPMFNLADFEAHARDGSDKNAWNFYSSGADQEQTLGDNVGAFKR